MSSAIRAAKDAIRSVLRGVRGRTGKTVRLPLDLQMRRVLRGGPSVPAPGGTEIAFATMGAGVAHLASEVMLAHALQFHGARCRLFLCDLPDVPGCDERTIHDSSCDRCPCCLAGKMTLLNESHVEWDKTSDFLSENPAEAIARAGKIVGALPDAGLESFVYRDRPLGRWIGTSVAHFLRADSHGDEPEVISARRRFLISAIVWFDSIHGWLDARKPEILIAQSCKHVAWRIAFELAREKGITVYGREMFGADFDTQVHSLNSSCEDPDFGAVWEEARTRELEPFQMEKVRGYLSNLPAWARQMDANPTLEEEPDHIRRELGLTPGNRLVVVFTNVTWDLFVAQRDHAFNGQMVWLRETFRILTQYPDVDIVVRAHPGEVVPIFRTRDRILDRVRAAFPELLDRLKFVDPSSKLSSDALRQMAALNIVYSATVGLESTISRQPILIAGHPYYSRRGFTFDVDSHADYEAKLTRWYRGEENFIPDEAASQEALRFLYLFRYRYGMSMNLTSTSGDHLELLPKSAKDLKPGANATLDLICDSILRKTYVLAPQ